MAVASLTHVWVVVNHTCPTQIKDLSQILLISFCSLSSLYLLSNKHLKQSFCYSL